MIFIVKLMMTAYDSRTNIPHNDRPFFSNERRGYEREFQRRVFEKYY